MKHLVSIASVQVLLIAATALAAEPATVGVVSHVKVLSDKAPDVSSMEAWRAATIRPGMSDREKALAIWETVVRFQHQDSPPAEYLHNEDTVLDPIKLFNVYGYSFCSVASANVQALARFVGLEARGWTIQAHVVPEVFWDGRWHLLDASLVNYFPKADGDLASVEEIVAAVKGWHAEHPQLKGNNAELVKFQQTEGWTGWRRGPALLTASPWYDAGGWWPAGTHGWSATMQEYDGSTLFPYESGYSQGYQVNIQLRPGMRLVRNWSNRGLHVNQPGDGPGCTTGKVGVDALRYTPRFGDLAPGRVGNGTFEYDVPLGDAALAAAALRYENLAPRDGALAVADGARPGVLELRLPSSYVYLTGELEATAGIAGDGRIEIFFSDNHGLDWRPLGEFTSAGPQRVDLAPHVLRRYDYRLRLVLHGAETSLVKLALRHDIQHSQRPLPVLAQGDNTITFSAGPQEGTVTLEGSVHPDQRGRQLVYTDFHPEVEGLAAELLRVEAREGQITLPVETPGDMVRLRFGCFYRARDAKDRWDLQVSFDGGRKFRTVDTAGGPKVFAAKWISVDDIPPGTRKALVRYTGTQQNTLAIMNLRVDADYREPAGGFRPVKVTYVWEETGTQKTDVHVARSPAETYTIHCAAAPVMESICLELAN